MIRKPEAGSRHEHAFVTALHAVATHGPVVARVGPLLLRGTIFGCFALFLGFTALQAVTASVGLAALILPAVSALAMASASARMFARALNGCRSHDTGSMLDRV